MRSFDATRWCICWKPRLTRSIDAFVWRNMLMHSFDARCVVECLLCLSWIVWPTDHISIMSWCQWQWVWELSYSALFMKHQSRRTQSQASEDAWNLGSKEAWGLGLRKCGALGPHCCWQWHQQRWDGDEIGLRSRSDADFLEKTQLCLNYCLIVLHAAVGRTLGSTPSC